MLGDLLLGLQRCRRVYVRCLAGLTRETVLAKSLRLRAHQGPKVPFPESSEGFFESQVCRAVNPLQDTASLSFRRVDLPTEPRILHLAFVFDQLVDLSINDSEVRIALGVVGDLLQQLLILRVNGSNSDCVPTLGAKM